MMSQTPTEMIYSSFFFFNDTATTEIYTLSLHDALPISNVASVSANNDREIGELIAEAMERVGRDGVVTVEESRTLQRSEEHTSELQSRQYLVCRLLLEKKKKNIINQRYVDTNEVYPHKS